MSGFTYPALTNSQISTLPARATRRHAGLLARILATVRLWRQRSRERAMLAELNARELADFGANTADVWRELNAPFWHIPPKY